MCPHSQPNKHQQACLCNCGRLQGSEPENHRGLKNGKTP